MVQYYSTTGFTKTRSKQLFVKTVWKSLLMSKVLIKWFHLFYLVANKDRVNIERKKNCFISKTYVVLIGHLLWSVRKYAKHIININSFQSSQQSN